VGTYAGLAKLAHPAIHFVRFGDETVLHHSYSIHRAGPDHFIVITDKAVYDFDSRTKENRRLLTVQPGHFPQAIQQTSGFSMVDGEKLYEYENQTGQLRQVTRHMPGFYCALRTNSFMATGDHHGALIVFNNGDTIRSCPGIRVHRLLMDRQNRLWIGSWNSGLFRITLDTLHHKVINTEDLTLVASDSSIRSLFEDSEGNIWVGTRYNGLTFFPANDDPAKRKQINHRNGLFSNWVYSFAETPNGNIWVGTLGGINKLVKEKGQYRPFNFSRINGYYANTYNMEADSQGSLWCASDNGLFIINDNYLERMPPMDVRITMAQLGRSDNNYADTSLASPITLRHNQNSSRFEFTAPGFINEKELMYSYRLLGSGDTSWTAPANSHSIQYANLKPGHYQFEVRMTGWNGEKGAITALPFLIRPPYWQTAWFRVSVALLVIAMFYLFYRYRIRQLLKLQRVRNNIATDLHDDIGSTLTNISILSQLSLSHLDQPSEARKFLHNITDQVQGSSEALDDIIWSVNSRHDSLKETLARMRRYAGDLFDHSSIRCNLDFAEPDEDIRLGMEQRRDLFLMYKELLNNTRKHAAATEVGIKVQYHNKQLKLMVTDNGKGFDPQRPHQRNGLKNLQVRASRWKGKVELETTIGRGSRFTIFLPIDQKKLA
jgi:two-component sensor histidine kinase